MLTHIDAFSGGHGGFALAAQWAGLKTVQLIEKDPWRQAKLKQNFTGVPIHGDIKTFKYSGDSPFLYTASPPCQAASLLGQRGGANDNRWLWPEALRIMREARPRYALFENVTGLLSLESGVEFENICLEMEADSYEVQPLDSGACAVGAPHRRRRIWILAHAKGQQALSPEQIRFYAESGRQDRGVWDKPWGEVALDLCDVKLDDGLPRELERTKRLSSAGDALVPQVAYEIIMAILDAEIKLTDASIG